jgi:pimeloyl-ACP methyl ester carboxylesterase
MEFKTSFMKTTGFFFFILFAVTSALAQTTGNSSREILKVEPKPSEGFAYPYYLYVPKAMREPEGLKKKHMLLVIPNNSGKLSDDFSVHEEDVKGRIKNNAQIADKIGVALLIPVFPRPSTNWQIYTHALDRDVMLTSKKELARFDLQLLAMIDDARARFAVQKIKFDERVLVLGFSASGMFANRFTFLHPKRVKAAVVGSPGGWPIAPAGYYKEKKLRYPIGIDDFKLISGRKIDMKNLRKVPLFLFMGGEDDNDSVIFRDSYEKEDEELIFALFGKTPVERWEISKNFYQENKLKAEFRLYPNEKHSVTKEMMEDILAFFSKHAAHK